MSAELRIVRDDTANVLAALTTGLDAGLVAAADVYADALREELLQGFTSGDFVTGDSSASVYATDPRPGDGENEREIAVSTETDYPWYWQLGHDNLFTKKFERVPVFTLTVDEVASQMAESFNASVTAGAE